MPALFTQFITACQPVKDKHFHSCVTAPTASRFALYPPVRSGAVYLRAEPELRSVYATRAIAIAAFDLVDVHVGAPSKGWGRVKNDSLTCSDAGREFLKSLATGHPTSHISSTSLEQFVGFGGFDRQRFRGASRFNQGVLFLLIFMASEQGRKMCRRVSARN